MPKTHHSMTSKRHDTLRMIIGRARTSQPSWPHVKRLPLAWHELTLAQKAAVRGLVKLGYVMVSYGGIAPTMAGHSVSGLT